MRRQAGAAAAAAILLVALTAMTGLGLLHQRPLPTINGHYRLLGLHDRAEVVRDAFGVPRIEAADAHDAFFLQGYVTAQDRLAQMEAMRAGAAGFAQAARDALARADADLRATLDAYANGVTKFITQHAAARALPAEIALTGRRPVPWTAADPLAIAAAYVEGPSRSLCAAVAGDRSSKGRPLLLAELDAAAPAPGWYEVGIEAPGIHALGISLPGVPGIVAGHNGWVAWSLHGAPGRTSDPGRTLRTILAATAARNVGDVTGPAAALQNGPVAGCLADIRGNATGLTPVRALLPDGAVLVSGGDETQAQGILRALLNARDIDIETMRVLLGRPVPADASARIVVDLADVDASKAVLSTGQSAHRASLHYRDQVPLWSAGQLHRLAWTRSAVARTEGQLVFRAR